MLNTSQTESIDMRRVFAIDLLDIPCSRSCIIGFALIFLAMITAPSVRSAPWREDRTEGGGGDTEPRIGRYGASESVARPSDTESVKRVLFKCRNTHFENNPESKWTTAIPQQRPSCSQGRA